MNETINFFARIPAYIQENAWLGILILIVFAVGLVIAWIVGADRRRDTAQRINSIDEYIADLKNNNRHTDAG